MRLLLAEVSCTQTSKPRLCLTPRFADFCGLRPVDAGAFRTALVRIFVYLVRNAFRIAVDLLDGHGCNQRSLTMRVAVAVIPESTVDLLGHFVRIGFCLGGVSSLARGVGGRASTPPVESTA